MRPMKNHLTRHKESIMIGRKMNASIRDKKAPEQKRPGGHSLRVLAVKYEVDPRSLIKEWDAPGSVRGMSGERARKALAEWREKQTAAA